MPLFLQEALRRPSALYPVFGASGEVIRELTGSDEGVPGPIPNDIFCGFPCYG